MPVALHTHSWYSLLEGASSPAALLTRAAACGYTALALTDTNNLDGAVAFTDRAHRHGVRPILGACLRQQRTRCVALIADAVGYRNLCRVLSRLRLSVLGETRSLAGRDGPVLPRRPDTANSPPRAWQQRRSAPRASRSPGGDPCHTLTAKGAAAKAAARPPAERLGPPPVFPKGAR